MAPKQYAEIKARVEAGLSLLSPIDPHVTSKGGIVLLYGPYPLKEAKQIADYYRQLNTDLPALLAEVESLRGQLRFTAVELSRERGRARVYRRHKRRGPTGVAP